MQSLRNLVILSGAISLATSGQGSPFTNNGLVGVGRIDANALDLTGQDTLGGIFSSLWIDQSSLSATVSSSGKYTYTGTLLGLPDRGFGDGARDYHPRIQTFDFTFTPVAAGYSGPALPQNQISLVNTGSRIFTYDTPSGPSTFTGFNPNNPASTALPQSAAGSLGGGRLSLDPEGLVRVRSGSYFVSDEYGPNIYKFDSSAKLIGTLPLPQALVPRVGSTVVYDQDQNGALTSGRRANRGLEGLTVSPDETRLFAMLQSPTDQDGGQDNTSRNTRILVYDLTQSGTPLVGEYVYQLTLQGNPSGTRNTPISEILALNNHEILVLERDGRGGFTQNNAPTYKSIVKADLSTGQNILGSSYDLANGEPGQTDFPNGLAIGVTPVAREELVNMLDTAQLAKFGLNINANPDANTLTEKWEGLGLIPDLSTAIPDDFFLFVGNDNDFLARSIIHNGEVVGTSPFTQDNMLLAYHVTLPGAQLQVPDLVPAWTFAGAFACLAGFARSRRNRV